MGTLHVVSTPIGNLEDVTLRALRVLGEAELVFAEDTRRTRILLDRHGISAKPVSFHAHNEASRIARALAVLESGGDVALVSDAGTPLVSDPGARLVAAVSRAGHEVTSVPGASALLGALTVAALPTERFSFLGFLPRRAGPRNALLASYQSRPETLVLFESPRRLPATLRLLTQQLGDRPACVARELTKRFEEIARGTLSELAEQFEKGARGEVTLVVGGADEAKPADPADIDADIRTRLARGESSREIAAALAPITNLPKRTIYERAVTLRRGD